MGAVGLRTAVALIQGIKLDKPASSQTTINDVHESNVLATISTELLTIIDKAFSVCLADSNDFSLSTYRKERLTTMQKSLSVLLHQAKTNEE
mmetsp:Transcript_5948/g.7488  ORF Transcript_5948/g.7488 Transcript_5948/m.7488 type:complete len:92 (+) Transcript_5948:1262-1537(+)